jgi:hypothetical protein
MYYVKLIKYFYLFLTILAVLSPVKAGLSAHVLGLVMMWLLYALFALGTKGVGKKEVNSKKKIHSFKIFPAIVAISYLIFYPIYVRFYTGQDIISAIINVMAGISNYSSYQEYFIESGLNSFSLAKLPFILGHGLLRFLFVVIVIRTIAYQSRIVFIEMMSLLIMTVMIIFVGFARGTSFELFELLVIYIYAILTRRALGGYKKLISLNLFLKFGFVGLLLVGYFTYNIQVRMGDSYTGIHGANFNENSIPFILVPPLALIAYSLYDYFVFGIYFTSTTITKLWFGSMEGFLSMFIPRGMELFQIDTGYRDFIGRFIDLGAKWNADTVVLVEKYGIVFLILLIYFIGYNSSKLFSKIETSIAGAVVLFYVCYVMISLPVGNFISSSSANVFAIMLGILFYKFRFLNKYLFNYLIP